MDTLRLGLECCKSCSIAKMTAEDSPSNAELEMMLEGTEFMYISLVMGNKTIKV